MTNGEKILNAFPNVTTRILETKGFRYIEMEQNDNWIADFNIDWWNAKYKESTTKNDLGVDCIDRAKAQTEIEMKASRYTIAKERGGMGQVEWSDQLIKVSDAVDIIRNLPSVTPQESVLDKINKMKSEIADSLEFWDYSPNNNPLARDMLETITNFWGDMRGEEE